MPGTGTERFDRVARRLAQCQELANGLVARVLADLAVELGNSLGLRPVLQAFSGGALLDEVDDAMRLHVGRRASSWWRDRRLSPDEVTTVRDTWRRVVTVIEGAIWPR